MKNLRLFATIIIGFLWYSTIAQLSLMEQLKKLPGVVSVDTFTTDTTFTQQFEIYFEQPIDHHNPAKGSFKQRVILDNKDINSPMVVDLEGYNIYSTRQEELTKLLKCNQVNIEHRFFKDSRPDSIPWDYLTIWQAATDQHEIIKALQQIYKQNWVSTGISKGGQTTMYHRSFYPDDVNASVCYVAPLDFAREDPRIYKFLKTVGTDADRKKIYDFQCQCFEKMDSLVMLLKQKAETKGWTYRFGYEKAMQYTILEYSFAFWQWGYCTSDKIPGDSASATELFDHLSHVSGFTFFEDASVEDFRPYFWAALTQIGIYGYQTKPFEKYLGDTIVYTFDFTAPEGTHPVYDPQPMQKVKAFLDNDATNMLFIVGGLDTWGSTAYVPSGKNNLVRMTLANGHHGTRIKNFDQKDREYMYSLMNQWLGTHITDPLDWQ